MNVNNVNRQVEECLWNCFEKNHLGPFMCTRRELSGRGSMRLNNNSSKSHHSVSCFSFSVSSFYVHLTFMNCTLRYYVVP